MEIKSKKAWQSKTLWTNVLMAALSFNPSVAALMTPEIISTIFLVINAILRFATESKITIT